MNNNEHDENLAEFITASKLLIPIISSSFKEDLLCVSVLNYALKQGVDIITILYNKVPDTIWLDYLYKIHAKSLGLHVIDLSDVQIVVESSLLSSAAVNEEELESLEMWIACTINERVDAMVSLQVPYA